MSRTTLAACLTLLVLSGCLQGTAPASEGPEAAGPSVWEKRLDAKYFDYEPWRELQVQYEAGQWEAVIELDAAMAYTGVDIVFQTPDPNPALGSGVVRAVGSWANGSTAFDVRPDSCCGVTIWPPSSGYSTAVAPRVLLRVPDGDRNLTIVGENGAPDYSMSVAFSTATPMTYHDEPPYVKARDPAYFDRVDVASIRRDFPAAPVADAPEMRQSVPAEFAFVLVEAQFYGSAASSTILLSGPGSWPRVHVGWDDSENMTAIGPTQWGFGHQTGPQGDLVQLVLRRPEGAQDLTFTTEGWGYDQYAEIHVFGAVPVDPLVGPVADDGTRRSSSA